MSKLRIWYNPQVPGKAFTKEVKSLEEAKLVANTLIEFSTFEFENNIKPDYSDVIDLEMFEDSEWVSWYDDDHMDFDELLDEK
jgi:hypoxanthine phosphoribosyltransferase